MRKIFLTSTVACIAFAGATSAVPITAYAAAAHGHPYGTGATRATVRAIPAASDWLVRAPENVTHISSGWATAVAADGTGAYTPGSVSASTPSVVNGNYTVAVLSSSSGKVTSLGILLPHGQQLAVGGTYSSSFSLTISVNGNPAADVCDTTPGAGNAQYVGEGAVSVDQVGYDISGDLTSLAAQYFCAATDGSVYFGAMAFNVGPSTPHEGYATYESNGVLSEYGNDHFLSYLGDLSASQLNKPIVGIAQTADGGGYWMVASDGGIFAFGDAAFYGSMGGTNLNQPIVGMAATPSGHGYWLVAADGGIFAFGDAGYFGSTGNIHLNKPVVGMAPTASGFGYWFVATDGGIFAYGDAGFHGSMGGTPLNKPVVGMALSHGGGGYWLVASDGGIFAFGDAGFFGSTGSIKLNQPIAGMASTPTGQGYWFVATDGGIFAFGNAHYYGSIPGDGVTVSDVAGIST